MLVCDLCRSIAAALICWIKSAIISFLLLLLFLLLSLYLLRLAQLV